MGSNCPAVLQFKWYDFGRLGSTIREAKKKRRNVCTQGQSKFVISEKFIEPNIFLADE